MVKNTNLTSQSENFEKFLINTISLFLFLFLFSCDKDEVENIKIEKSLELQIENDRFKIVNAQLDGIENCDRISIGVMYQKSEKENFTIVFNLLKNGGLEEIRLIDYHINNDFYETADFNSTGLMKIVNFKYYEANKYLHFEFDGELITVESDYNSLDKNQPRKHIQGAVTVNNLRTIECNTFISNLDFETPFLKFTTTRPFANYDSGLKTNPYHFYFYSDNGYRTIFKSKVDLWNQEKGTYNFDQNSIENRIDFEQYIGIFRATQLLWIRDIDWKKFQTSGSYTILGHQIINGQKVTNGEFNIQIFDNGVSKHNITNAKFEVIGF